MKIDLTYHTVFVDDNEIAIKLKSTTKFRKDMNVKKAIKDLTDNYIDEAIRRVGQGYGCQTRAAKLLGFQSYQAFSYWLKRKEKSK
jgi:hypothetical protein